MSEGGPVKDKDCVVMEGTDHVESYEPGMDFDLPLNSGAIWKFLEEKWHGGFQL